MEVYLISLLAIFLISTVVWKKDSFFEKKVKEDQETKTMEVEERPPLLLLEALDKDLVQLAYEDSKFASIEVVETSTLGVSIENFSNLQETEAETEPEISTELVTEDIPAEEMSIEDIRDFYYSFDTYTDMSINLGVSKQQFVEILNALPYDYANVFKDNAEFLWETAKKYDFNEFLMVGIMANESYWGADPIAPNNYSSQRISGDDYYTYDTAEEGIEALASNLANNYLTEGGKYYSGKSLNGIGIIYCEGNTWADAVCTCMNMVFREYFKDE